MHLWICHWPNGQVSIVHANDARHAEFILRCELDMPGGEILGPEHTLDIERYPKELAFLVTFTPMPSVRTNPNEKSCWVFEEGDFPPDAWEVLGDSDEALEQRQTWADRQVPDQPVSTTLLKGN